MCAKSAPLYLKTAYLGPQGTYTDLALQKLGQSKATVPCVSIPAVFEMVAAGEADSGFVPLENMIQGPITETLDLLLEYRERVFIENSFTMPIFHALGILPTYFSSIEKDLGKVPAIYSRDQAIQQCARFLKKRMPAAELRYVESTTAAMQLVSKENLPAAVIGSKESLEEAGFEIVAENVADVSFNKTRFALIRKGNINNIDEDTRMRIALLNEDLDFVTSIAIDPRKDRQGILHDMLDVISSKHQVNMLSIHSRPNAAGGFVFYLDLEGHVENQAISGCLNELRAYCRAITGDTAEITVFGCYPREAFRPAAFRTVGVIGGEGVMGRWFRSFLSNAGCLTLSYDLGTDLTLEELCRQSDVILISVPMSQARDVAEKLLPLLKTGHLVVENCSIKNCILPMLEENLPQGVELLGLHTMFKGDIEKLSGENVVITKTKFSGEKSGAFEDLLYKYGAKIIYADVERHDHTTAFTQSLQHLVLLALAKVMADNYASVEEVLQFNTKISRQVIALIKRTLKQSDSLIIDLQAFNHFAPNIRNRFLEVVFRMIAELNNNEYKALLDEVKAARDFFGDELERN